MLNCVFYWNLEKFSKNNMQYYGFLYKIYTLATSHLCSLYISLCIFHSFMVLYIYIPIYLSVYLYVCIYRVFWTHSTNFRDHYQLKKKTFSPVEKKRATDKIKDELKTVRVVAARVKAYCVPYWTLASLCSVPLPFPPPSTDRLQCSDSWPNLWLWH